MLYNTRFFAQKKYAFHIDNSLLTDLYSPIIGWKATLLYTKLLNECEKQMLTMSLAGDINDFIRQTSLSFVEFSEARAKLEAVSLLETYLSSEENKNTYTFIVNDPLKFDSFIENQKYRHLLIKNIGQTSYERLEYLYTHHRSPINAENVSSTFENVFNDAEINSIALVNFNELYQRIATNVSLPVIIPTLSKNIIESYFKSYDLSLKEIEHVVYDCVIQSDDGNYHVDSDLLNLRFKKLVESNQQIHVLKNIKLNRNTQMFLKHLQPNDLQLVFADYRTLNAEQYLRSITKHSLTNEQVNTITKLREKYGLCDYIINLLVDYTLFKANGNLNEKYINKVASTINALGLKTLEQIYDHFHFINVLDNKTNEPLANLIEWDK